MNIVASTGQFVDQMLARLLRRWKRHMSGLERDATETQIVEDGALGYSFVFLVATSCCIATLGLLLNSAAVIIGAMLVAPLMGPIVLLGFSIAKTDVELAVKGGKAMLVGVMGALATSWLIVTVSPYIPPTSEILARTNPNLFDLLVAVASGLVAGYAVIRRKIGTVAGVAIATALMPPLAVAGYGLAIMNAGIFQGAFYLFLTNMVAIALSVAGMAIWYGFGNLRARENLLWQTLAAGVILALLSIPLINTLNESVARTLTMNQVESVIRQQFELGGNSLEKLSVEQTHSGALQVDVVVFVSEYDASAQNRIEAALRQSLQQKIRLNLDQVVMGDSVIKLAERGAMLKAAEPAAKVPEKLTQSQVFERYLKTLLPLPVAVTEIDDAQSHIKVQVSSRYDGELRTLMQMEQLLQQRFPDWNITLIPPITALPQIRFDARKSDLTEDAQRALAVAAWSMRRWEVQRAVLAGSASYHENAGKTAQLVQERNRQVAAWLADAGLTIAAATRQTHHDQRAQEREFGPSAFRHVLIQPLFVDPAPVTSLDSDGIPQAVPAEAGSDG